MGLNYGFDIYCHRNKLWEFIDSVMELASPNPNRSSTIILGDQKKIVLQWLPYDSTVMRLDDPDSDEAFCLSIPFAVDDAIKEFVAEHGRYDNRGRACIGCIYFYIVVDLESMRGPGPGFDANLVLFHFYAATTSMSRMFQQSQSVRQTFVELAKKHDATYCIFSTGGQGRPTVLWLDGKEYSIDIFEDSLPLSEVRQIVSSSIESI